MSHVESPTYQHRSGVALSWAAAVKQQVRCRLGVRRGSPSDRSSSDGSPSDVTEAMTWPGRLESRDGKSRGSVRARFRRASRWRAAGRSVELIEDRAAQVCHGHRLCVVELAAHLRDISARQPGARRSRSAGASLSWSTSTPCVPAPGPASMRSSTLSDERPVQLERMACGTGRLRMCALGSYQMVNSKRATNWRPGKCAAGMGMGREPIMSQWPHEPAPDRGCRPRRRPQRFGPGAVRRWQSGDPFETMCSRSRRLPDVYRERLECAGHRGRADAAQLARGSVGAARPLHRPA